METQAVTRVIRRRKNTAAELPKGEEHIASTANDSKLIDKATNPEKYYSRAEKLAQNKFCIMNWKWPHAESHFPNEPWMRSVSKYFPYAKGGPLLIEECELPYQIERAERKAKFLKQLGLRFMILKPGTTEAEDLAELHKCG